MATIPPSPTSPITPMSTSPISTGSSTSTSSTSLTDLTWKLPTTPPQRSFVSDLNSPTIRSPSNRSFQSTFLSSSTNGKSFAERAGRCPHTLQSLMRSNDPANDYKMTLSDDAFLLSGYAEESQAGTKTDAMMTVDDSLVFGRRRNARDESLNSLVLERIIEFLPKYRQDMGNDDTTTNITRENSCMKVDMYSGGCTREVREQSVSVLGQQRSIRAQTRTSPTTRLHTYHSPSQSRCQSRSRSSTRSLSRNRRRTLHSCTKSTRDSDSASRYQHQQQHHQRQGRHQKTKSSSSSHSLPLSAPPSKIPPPPQPQTQPQTQTPFSKSLSHLSTKLTPLISVTSGQPHPQFPTSLLQYHLLTHNQLDSLARWYHQTIDGERERWMYPDVIARPWCFSSSASAFSSSSLPSSEGDSDGNETRAVIELNTKRRRFGKFIGLRGCESPIVPSSDTGREEDERESVTEKMEREWKRALGKAEEEERVLEKVWRGRF